MWISKVALMAFTEQIDYLRKELAEQRVQELREITGLLGELNDLRRENTLLRERFVAAEGKTRAAQARADLITVRLNQLQEERDGMFTKVTGMPVTTPKISHMPVVMPPGVNFEDMGDAQARAEGYDLELPVSDLEEIEGMAGRVFDPNAEGPNPPPPPAPLTEL